MSLCDAVSPLLVSPGLPRSGEGDPVFAEPWQAEVFAITVHLHERGLFTWPEWASHLTLEVHRAGRAEDGSDYFEAWVAALTRLLAEKGVADETLVLALQQSWQRAAEATPHGQPIQLENDPHRSRRAEE
ncbi:nitrile hydratase accessory protein [Rhizobium sp. CSW-27]|uniref:nitrile hydratase accessory protein n=1 Tax=Rhizobium sp. CSW-27 TaxID=2839985 RepID=UPI001C022E88|nr:nitrile hydratase accessory protein [Rhizobium sp. CSW-27]MBT9370974.1 nitrile hydratase accessory protein [Rhizobium sp. CSW-27]